MKRLSLLAILAALLLPLISHSAEKQSYREAIEGLDPMDLSEVDPQVAGLLRKYYKYTFGDPLTWEATKSLRIEGELSYQTKTYQFVAYQKKPDFVKLVIDLDAGGTVAFGYNGEDAWQLNTLAPDAEPVSMPEGEALNFIRDAAMGGHLLYPQLKGKQFEFEGTALVEGDRVYELKTTLPSGQVIRSFFDMTSFAELYRILVNNANQDEELNVYTDFRKIDGLRIPYSTTLIVDGKQAHQFRTTKVQTNTGAMPWIFNRAPAASGTRMNSFEDVTSSSDLYKPVEGSAFSIEGADIWAPASGVVGSAFQIESASPDEDSHDSGADDSNQESEK